MSESWVIAFRKYTTSRGTMVYGRYVTVQTSETQWKPENVTIPTNIHTKRLTGPHGVGFRDACSF